MNKNKERDFENATQSLIRQIDSMNLEKTERLQVKNFILLLFVLYNSVVIIILCSRMRAR